MTTTARGIPARVSLWLDRHNSGSRNSKAAFTPSASRNCRLQLTNVSSHIVLFTIREYLHINWGYFHLPVMVLFGVNSGSYCFHVWQLELTPTRQGELQHVSAEVRREDLHNAQVHVHCLQARPGEGGQQEVVQGGGGADAQRLERVARQPAVQQEDQVEEQEGGAQLDQDPGRDVPQELPASLETVISHVSPPPDEIVR